MTGQQLAAAIQGGTFSVPIIPGAVSPMLPTMSQGKEPSSGSDTSAFRNTSVIVPFGVVMSAPLDRVKDSGGKAKETAAIETMIERKVKGTPTTCDVNCADDLGEYMTVLGKKLRVVRQYEPTLDYLEKHTTGQLQKRIQTSRNSLSVQRLLENKTDALGIEHLGLTEQNEHWENDQCITTEKGSREVARPDYTPVYKAFVEELLRNSKRKWVVAHGQQYKNVNCLQGDATLRAYL